MKKYAYQEAKKIILSICKAAENGEYETREKFYAMMEAHPYIAVQGYNPFGKIFFWNTASVQLYGYRASEIIGKDLFDLVIPPEMRPLARDLILSATKTGKTPDPSSCDLIHRNGEFITAFSGHLMFRWENPAVPEFYCVDIGIDPLSV